MAFSAQAQFGTCTADPTFIDSLAGVYPLPFDETTNPEGGIPDSACLNKNYQFVFNAVVNDTINVGGIPFVLDSLKFPLTGAVAGLPTGITYACDPPSCVFQQNTVGCVVLYGKATDPADLGQNELLISATLFTGGLPIPLTFPNPTLFPGHYYLYVLEEDSPNCAVYSNTTEPQKPFTDLRTVPNPFTDETVIELTANLPGVYQFQVTDMLGRVVHRQTLQLVNGLNQIPFDGASLSNGIYWYTLQNGQARLTAKMVKE